MKTTTKDEEVTVVEPKPAAKPVAAPAPVRRTAEEIATERGWLPAFIEGPGGPNARRTKNPNWWKYAAAYGHKPLGQEVTDEEFDAAVNAAINTIHG